MCDLNWSSYILGGDKFNAEFEILYTHVAVAANGGPVALMNKRSHLLSGSSHLLKKHIAIFNGSGNLITKIPVFSKLINSGLKK